MPFNLINIVNNIDPMPIGDRNKKTKKDINSSTNHQNFLGESNVDVPVEKITEIEKQVGSQESVLTDDSLENYYTESFSNDQKYNTTKE